ncbi:MAG: 30S ribosomal protein S7 [Candidatus Altiarchaeota archaeon]|nr:30S ribosomal protein S7 [Candidatus Altiarchaeota archaeon]
MKLFGKWTTDGIEVRDKGLAEYINLDPQNLPDKGGKYAKRRFGRRKYSVVERLTNKLMVTGHIKAGKKHVYTSGRNSGKKIMAMKIVEDAFTQVEEKLKKNPIQVLVTAVEYAAPRAEVTTVEYGGIRSPVAVDTAPIRRVDLALSFIAKGAAQKSNRKKTSIAEALAQEIMAAAANDSKTFSVDRKSMLERQSEASR